jgi:prophage regulatory protein
LREEKKMMIKNNGPNEPPLDGGDRAPDSTPPRSTQLQPRRMLNEKQVLEIVPVSRSTLWRMEKQGKFPRSTYISSNRRFWFADEVTEWQNRINGQGRHGRPRG